MTGNIISNISTALKDMVCKFLASRPKDLLTLVTIFYDVDYEGLRFMARSFVSRIISREPWQGFQLEDDEVDKMTRFLYTGLWIRYSFLFDKKDLNEWLGHDKTNVLQNFQVPAFWSCWLSAIGSLQEPDFGIEYKTKIDFTVPDEKGNRIKDPRLLTMEQYKKYQTRICYDKYGLSLVPITNEPTGDPDFLTCFLGCSEEIVSTKEMPSKTNPETGNTEPGYTEVIFRQYKTDRLYTLKDSVAPGIFILAGILRPNCYRPGFEAIGHYFGTTYQAKKELELILQEDRF